MAIKMKVKTDKNISAVIFLKICISLKTKQKMSVAIFYE